jgi:hypothetical protein
MWFICINALQFGNSISKTGPLSSDSPTLPQVADLEDRMSFGLTHRYLLGDSTNGKNIFYGHILTEAVST